MLKRTLTALSVSAAALVLTSAPAMAGPSEAANFAGKCAKGGGAVSAGHGHDHPYLQCNGGRYNGERHYL